MSNNKFKLREDINRFKDPNYEIELILNIKEKINSIIDNNKIRIETLLSFTTNSNNSDMRGEAKIFSLERLYCNAEKYSK